MFAEVCRESFSGSTSSGNTKSRLSSRQEEVDRGRPISVVGGQRPVGAAGCRDALADVKQLLAQLQSARQAAATSVAPVTKTSPCKLSTIPVQQQSAASLGAAAVLNDKIAESRQSSGPTQAEGGTEVVGGPPTLAQGFFSSRCR
mmetsp:Transcript_118672/g.272315  ORF Transcript_118672/g.272315 Transcript_118672/m.272315 type:complete len:145 (-) Transcript_118672:242-676(-)